MSDPSIAAVIPPEAIDVPGHGTIHDAVIADIRDREQKGIAEYGGPHRLHNGLDGLREAYEEALDMAFWLRQEIEERQLEGWGAARDRVTESNAARRDERERCARIVEVAPSALAAFEEIMAGGDLKDDGTTGESNGEA